MADRLNRGVGYEFDAAAAREAVQRMHLPGHFLVAAVDLVMPAFDVEDGIPVPNGRTEKWNK